MAERLFEGVGRHIPAEGFQRLSLLADRFAVHPGGGFLPNPVGIVVDLGGTAGIKNVVCVGTKCDEAPGAKYQARLRTFWYKEME